MDSSSNQLWQASLAINHLNEVIHDLSGERDRLAALHLAECERHASLRHSVDVWMAELHQMTGDLQVMTENMLEAVAEVDCSALDDADTLLESARLMSVQRLQIKALRGWLRAQRAETSLPHEDEAPRRVSRLNHLSGPVAVPSTWGSSSSEWGELSCVSGPWSRDGFAPAPAPLSDRF